MNTKNNMRYKNTEALIEITFLNLLEEKEIRQITIGELCQLTQINRSTFYAHYQDIYDLLDKIEDRLSKILITEFQQHHKANPVTNPGDYIDIFLTYTVRNKTFYRNFVNNQHVFPIRQGYDALLHQFIIPYYQSLGIVSESEIIYRFVFMQAGFTMVLKRWLNDNCQESHEKISDIILSCFFGPTSSPGSAKWISILS